METKKHLGILLLLCAIFFLGNGMIPITDQVESNYALTAKEMLASGDYFSPRIYGNYWYDKPIFFYWELIAAFSLLGATDFAARLFPGLFASLGVLLTYAFGRHLYGARTGFFAAAMLATSLGYWLVAKSVITDATLFVFLNGALVFFYLGYTKDRRFYYAAYLSAGLAVLTKGPVGIVLPGLIIIVFLLVRCDLGTLRRQPPLGLLLFALVGGSWYAGMYALHGMDFISNFFGVHNILRATVAEHASWNVWYFYPAIFLVTFFPWSFALIVPLIRRLRHGVTGLAPETLFLLIWALGVNVFFQLVATKYSTYTLPALMPIALLTARLLLPHIHTLYAVLLGAILIGGGGGGTVVLLTPIHAADGRIAQLLDIPGQSGYSVIELFSGKWQASVLRAHVQPDDLIVSYGEYLTSVVYYTDHIVYDLVPAAERAERTGTSIDWQRKYVMPVMSFDELPRDRDVYLLWDTRRDALEEHFAPTEWQLLAAQKHVCIYRRTKNAAAADKSPIKYSEASTNE